MPAVAGRDIASRAVAMLDAARGGSGGLLLLTGEAGIGKTHLAERVVAGAPPGFFTAWAAVRAGAPAFWPWIQVLRSLRLPDLLTGTGEAGDLRSRFELFDSVTDALATAATGAPLLVVLDDLHEADTASLLLLDHLASRLRGVPMLLVATARPGRSDAVWADLVRAGEVLQVAPLGTNDIGAMLQAATGSPADPVVVQRILARTGGNAFFVCELIKLANIAVVDTLPETVRAVVAARVAKQSPGCRTMLAAAAALGTTAALPRVIEVLGESPSAAVELIDEAIRDGLLTRTGGDTVRFTHEIVRDAVYENLSVADRLHWHREIASVVAREPAPSATEVAEHLRLAGPESRGEAGRWWERAGDERMSALAYEDAARCYERALEAPGWAGVRQLHLGDAKLAYGDAAGARTAYLSAAETARRGGDAGLLAAAALGLGSGPSGFEVALQDREQIRALTQTLTMLPDSASSTRAMVLARLSVALTFTAALDRRAKLAAEALSLATQCGDEAALAAALASHCDVISGPESVDERLAHTDRIIEIAERLRDSSLELLGRRMRVVARLELGDMAGFADDARIFDVVAGAMRQPLYCWYRPMWQAMAALSEGRFDVCRAALAEAVSIGTRAGSDNCAMLTATLQWCLDAASHDLDHVAASIRTLDEIDAVWVSFTKALVYAQLERIDDARAALDVAMSVRDGLPHDGNWLATVAQVAETLGIVGPHPIAEWVYDQLRPHGRLFVVEGIGAVMRGSVERHLGLAAAALGRTDAAAAHFDRALEANRRLGARLLISTTIADAARSLGRTPEPVAEARFARHGELWHLAYAGTEVTVRDSKGLRDIARLLANPGTPVPALDLVSGGGRGHAPVEEFHEPGNLGDVVDQRARREYRRRLAELDDDAAQADSDGDVERSARIAAERDALVDQLSAAFGLGGRPRRAGSPVERARTTVTARIRDAVRRVQAVHPELGRHLVHSVNTGTVCSYEPETEVRWLTS